MRRLRAIQKSDSTAVFLRHFFGAHGTGLRRKKTLTLIFFLVLFYSTGGALLAQEPTYVHSPLESKNLDAFSITLTDAINPQAKINRLIIAVDVGPDGEVYVLTFGNGIKRIGANGGLIDFIPNTSNRLSNSLDFAINSDGKFFVATNESNRRFIRVYSPKGVYLPGETLGNGDYGTGADKFKGPSGLTFDSNDNLYVADHYLGDADPPSPSAIKIYRKDAAGNYKNNLIREFDNVNGTLLNFPYRIAVNSSGQLYMSELGQNNEAEVKIIDFDDNFNPISLSNGPSANLGAPGSIIIDKFDYVFVADFGNEIDLPRLLAATDDIDEFYAVFEIIKNGIKNNIFKINIYNPNDSFRSTISSQIDFPIDFAISPCGTLYANNAVFDGELDSYCIPFFGCTDVPDFDLDFDLEVYNRSSGYDTDAPSLVSCSNDLEEELVNGSFAIGDYSNLAQFTDDCDDDLDIIQTPPVNTYITETTTITLTAKDDSGNESGSCSFQIIINDPTDTTDPVFTNCPSEEIIVVNDVGQCGAIVNYSEPTATDDSGAVDIVRTDGPAPGEFFAVGTTTVTYTATDDAGNSASCSFTITVTDDEAPKITCPPNVVETADFGETGVVVNFTEPVPGDNCSVANFEQTGGLPSGSEFPVGVTTNTYVVTDVAENTFSCSFTVTINQSDDEENPVISCPGDIEILNDPGQCGAVVTYPQPQASDNGGSPQITKLSGPDSGEFLAVGEHEVVFEARDAADNTATCTFVITVKDEEIPVFTTCPSNLTQYISAENGVYLVPDLLELVTATDNCSSILNYSQSLPVGTELTSDTSVSITASDEYGNESEACSIELVLVEEEQPGFECGIPPATLDLDENCNYPERDFSYLITNRENFSDEPFIEQLEQREGDVLNVKLKVYDGIDSTGDFIGQCDFQFSLVDNLDPVLQACDQSTVSLNLSPGESFIVPDYSGKISYTDNCGPLQVVQLPEIGSTITQNTTVTLRVVDEAGNSSEECSFSINFDQIQTSISCRTATISLGNLGTATLDPESVFDGDPSDPQIQNLEVSPNVFDCEDLGLQPVELTVTYTDGSTAQCNAQVEVVDEINPEMNCPNQEVNQVFDPREGYILPDYSAEFSVEDNCGFSVTQVPEPGTVIFESRQIELIVEDSGGNITTCNFTLRLNSTEDFRITSCPASQTLEASENCSVVLPDFTLQVETSEPYVNIIQLPSPGTRISEPTEVSITVTGPNGVNDTCSFIIDGEDTTPPVVQCPNNITVQAPAGENFVLPDYKELLEITENCSYSIEQSPAPGVEISGNETEILFSVTNEAGLTVSCSFTLFLADNAPLEITCPGDQEESFEDNCAFVLPDYTEMASVTWPTAQVTQDPPAGTSVSGSTQITLTAADGSETASCTFNLEVVEETPPSITCRETFTLYLNEEGYGILSADILLESAQDNCGIQSTVLSKTRFETTDIGENEVVVTVTDVNGLVSSCITTVIVIPFEQSGGVSCTESITLSLDEEGKRELILNYTGNKENIALELSKKDFTCDDIGSQMITATYYGEHTGSCEIEIVVVDDLPPVVNCVSEVNLILDQNGEAELSSSDVDLGSSDNCGIENVRLSKSRFTTEDLGTQQVRLIVTDSSGNSNFCEVTVNVNPYMATTGELNCKEKVVLELNYNGEVTLTAQDLYAGDPTGLEFFGEISYTCEDLGIHTVILSKKDDPSQSCEVEVEVMDKTAPVTVCLPDLTINLNANGTAALSAEEFGNGSTDNCEIASMSLDRTTFTTADIGQQQVLLTVKDTSGNFSTCEGTVTIVANEENPSRVQCADLVTLSLDATGRAEIEPEDLFSGGTSTGTYTVSQSLFTCEDLGEKVVTLNYSTEFEEGSCQVRVGIDDPFGLCENAGPIEGDTLILYPNPGDGFIRFELSPGLQIDRIEVFDVRGRFILEHQYDNTVPPVEYTLDLRAYQAGVYPMMIYTNGREYLKRAIIK
ncbi:HYR domain-containing protein [Salinimicrobium sp. HB62]|uniref:HYR domain-containing protein n=1 Tax=Salinimicrobium sp. HB62 TaxID=3077781 RepID=UPI002D789223|nr:HYR domain-containing protein [Salinimicrobium sp. HB62]